MSGNESNSILVDHWTAKSARLRAMFDEVLNDVTFSQQVTQAIPEYIEFGQYRKANIAACRNVGPHIDWDFGPYTALWVMMANGHKLGVSKSIRDYSHNARRPVQRVEYPAIPGDIAIIDVNTLHWCTKGTGVFAAVSIDFEEIPTHAEAEEAFVKACWRKS